MEEGPKEIVPRRIPWWRALFVFPLIVVPLLLLRALVHGARSALRKTAGSLRSRRRSPAAPQPLGAAGLLLAWLLVPAVLGIWFVASGVADRVEASGLLLVAVATVCASPNLLPLDVLARLDRWWVGSELPSYQLAFAHHAQRGVTFLLRAILVLLGATFLLGALDVVFTLLPLPSGLRIAADGVPGILGSVFAGLVTSAALVALLRVLFGAPRAYPDKAVPVVLAAEGLQDPGRQRALLRVAAVLFATGTALSFVAVVFLHR